MHLKWVSVDTAPARMQQMERFHVNDDIPVPTECV